MAAVVSEGAVSLFARSGAAAAAGAGAPPAGPAAAPRRERCVLKKVLLCVKYVFVSLLITAVFDDIAIKLKMSWR